MAVFPQFERITWFDDCLRRRRYPNASHLAQRFEISHKTAQRDICLLRDRMSAPIAYDHSRRGYYYTDDTFFLPRLPATQEEMLAVLVARRLLSRSAGGFIGDAFRGLCMKLLDSITALGLDEARLDEAFSSYWHGYSPSREGIFRTMVEALIQRRTVRMEYSSPGSTESTRRVVEPHHLQHYMASWVLIAYCRLREDWRKFYLSRIDGLDILSETFETRPRAQWAPHVEGAFGIFQGAATLPVTLRFTPFRARWVREQVWHPSQEVRATDDGGLELTFPVADFREVRMMILQFGADVRVIEPEALRNEIEREIDRMQDLYGTVQSS